MAGLLFAADQAVCGALESKRLAIWRAGKIRYAMKFYTMEVLNESDTVELTNPLAATDASYREHLQKLDLPRSLRAIADPYLVHDGLIARLTQSDDPSELSLTLRCGWLDVGYSSLKVRYDTPEILDEDLKCLVYVASNTITCRRFFGYHAYAHELDLLSDGRFQHSLLFPGVGSVAIRCESMLVRQTPTRSRRLPPYARRYVVERFGTRSG